MRKRVWFHRARAIVWVIIGAASYPLGWANSVAVVWTASLYANIMTDWGAAEAADEHEVMDELAEIKKLLREHIAVCQRSVVSDHGPEE